MSHLQVCHYLLEEPMSDNGRGSTALAVQTEPVVLAPRSETYEPSSIQEALQLARVLVNSRLLPRAIQTPEAAFTIILAGKELGLTAMQSIRSMHVIEGKPTLSADLMVALVKRSPVCRYFRLIRSDDKVATYETVREGDPAPTTMSFTIEEAQRAQLTGKDNWKKYPAAMLRARCGAALARAVYPELVMGVYDTDELEERPVRKSPAPLRGTVTDAGVTVDSASDADAMIEEVSRGFVNWDAKRAWADANKERKAALQEYDRERVTAAFKAAPPTRKPADPPPPENAQPDGQKSAG